MLMFRALENTALVANSPPCSVIPPPASPSSVSLSILNTLLPLTEVLSAIGIRACESERSRPDLT